MAKQIKSRKRVTEHGEVFTGERFKKIKEARYLHKRPIPFEILRLLSLKSYRKYREAEWLIKEQFKLIKKLENNDESTNTEE